MKYHCFDRRFAYLLRDERAAPTGGISPPPVRDCMIPRRFPLLEPSVGCLKPLISAPPGGSGEGVKNLLPPGHGLGYPPSPGGHDVGCRDMGMVGSLAGAAYLLNNNAGVLSGAQCEQKSHVEHKGKSSVDFDFQYESKR